MDSSIVADIDQQIVFVRQALAISKNLKEKCSRLESEKNVALEKCAKLEAEIDRLNKEKCSNCSILLNQLNAERKKKDELKKEEKAKLLKMIAKTLENLDECNTNQMTSAQQLFTQLVCAGLDDTPVKEKKSITLIEDDSEDEADSKVLANKTLVVESEEPSNDCNLRFGTQLVVPETEVIDTLVPDYNRNSRNNKYNIPRLVNNGNTKINNKHAMKENRHSSEEDVEIQPIVKKSKSSPVLSKSNATNRSPSLYQSSSHNDKVVADQRVVINQSMKSPSVLSEIIDAASSRSIGTNEMQEDKTTMWKMRPNVLVESNGGTLNGKKMKQMTLSLSRAEKKHDISLSEGFKGGVAGKHSDDDMVLPSPDRSSKMTFSRKNKPRETMEDPDITVFSPIITSTCLPLETSYDRVPSASKSPTFKYRRDTVRKKEERLKLPGQDCDECARYYRAAGLDETHDIRKRMNACSRHRDKYQIRANTPPGFWDPVLPLSPEGSQ